MTDDLIRRRPHGLESRVTVLEVEMRAHLQASDKLHLEQSKLLLKLDERADRSDLAFAQLLAKLSVVISLGVFAANFLAPIVLQAIGYAAK